MARVGMFGLAVDIVLPFPTLQQMAHYLHQSTSSLHCIEASAQTPLVESSTSDISILRLCRRLLTEVIFCLQAGKACKAWEQCAIAPASRFTLKLTSKCCTTCNSSSTHCSSCSSISVSSSTKSSAGICSATNIRACFRSTGIAHYIHETCMHPQSASGLSKGIDRAACKAAD